MEQFNADSDAFKFVVFTIQPAARRYGRRWCHLMADGDLEELHEFARRLGLRRHISRITGSSRTTTSRRSKGNWPSGSAPSRSGATGFGRGY